jgi:hypothetical protein
MGSIIDAIHAGRDAACQLDKRASASEKVGLPPHYLGKNSFQKAGFASHLSFRIGHG